MTTSNIVDLAAHLAKSQKKQDAAPVKLVDYAPTPQDVLSFMRVLRHLQHQSNTRTATVESNSEGITLVLPDAEAPHEDDEVLVQQYTNAQQRTLIKFPFVLLDVDPSELTIFAQGMTAVDMAADAIAQLLTNLKDGPK